MTQPTDPTIGDQTADALCRIADQLAGQEHIYAPTLTVQFYRSNDDNKSAEQIDRIAVALFGEPGAPEPMGSGSWQHRIDRRMGPVQVILYTGCPPPPDERDEEIARLRAVIDTYGIAVDTSPAAAAAEVPAELAPQVHDVEFRPWPDMSDVDWSCSCGQGGRGITRVAAERQADAHMRRAAELALADRLVPGESLGRIEDQRP